MKYSCKMPHKAAFEYIKLQSNYRWLKFSVTKVHGEIRTGSPHTGATNAGGVG